MILATSPQVETNGAGDAESPDPVYGHALARTWAWLDKHACGEPRSVDFGVDALESILPQGQDLSMLCEDVRSAYPLLPSHLDLLAQTSPPPEPDPEISAFLHGMTRTSPDVTVVWRAELPAAQPGIWSDRVAVQPPAPGEGCPVPIWEFRRWLANGNAWSPSDDSGDVEGIGDGAEAQSDGKRVVLGDMRRRVVEAGGAYGIVGRRGSAEDLSTADDRSSHSVIVPLADHSAGVRDYAERFARAVVLPDKADRVVSDLALAGWLHDVGKADPRFQVWLHGGDEMASALAEAPLAKSSQNPRNRAAIHRARERAGYPQGGRHEVQSLALIADQQQIRDQANDWDLVQHLVVSHHGFGRPFVPVVFDPQPEDVALRHGDVDLAHRSDHELYRIEAGVPERYWRLVRRYGWWGLAWLEAILGLADQRRSEHEERRRLGDA